MAPIQQRDYCDGDANCLNPQSPWYEYGRWILLAIIVALALIIFVVFSFFSARRRKRLGDNPLPLTGWAHRPDKSQWEQGYKQRGPGSDVSGQTSGLAEPEPVHTDGYAPPAGPPPGKTAI